MLNVLNRIHLLPSNWAVTFPVCNGHREKIEISPIPHQYMTSHNNLNQEDVATTWLISKSKYTWVSIVFQRKIIYLKKCGEILSWGKFLKISALIYCCAGHILSDPTSSFINLSYIRWAFSLADSDCIMHHKVNAWATRPPKCSSLRQHPQYILSNVIKIERNRATSSGNQDVLADTRYKNTLIFTEARLFFSRFYVFYVPKTCRYVDLLHSLWLSVWMDWHQAVFSLCAQCCVQVPDLSWFWQELRVYWK